MLLIIYLFLVKSVLSDDFYVIPVPCKDPPRPTCIQTDTVLVSKVVKYPENFQVHWRQLGPIGEDRGRGIYVFNRSQCIYNNSYYLCSENIPVPLKGDWAFYWTYLGDISDINCYTR